MPGRHYIRKLVYDVGEVLGVGAHMSELIPLLEASGSGSPKLAHMSTNPKHLANIIDEFPNVSAGLASDPEKNFPRIDLYISDVVDPPLSHIPSSQLL